MATWLAYLKSVLLPEDDDDDFKALEVAENKLQLKTWTYKNFIRSNVTKKDLEFIFLQGEWRRDKINKNSLWCFSLRTIKKLCWNSNAKNLSKYYYSQIAVLTTEEGIKQIKNNLDKINEWKNIVELIPNFYKKQNEKNGIAGIFCKFRINQRGINKNFSKNIR